MKGPDLEFIAIMRRIIVLKNFDLFFRGNQYRFDLYIDLNMLYVVESYNVIAIEDI